MFWTAIGEVFPVAIAIGLSPFAVITVVVLLMGSQGRFKATLFAAGWFVMIVAIVAGAYVVADATIEADAEAAADGIDVVQLVLGLGFFGLAWLSWRKRPSEGETARESRMLDRITRIGAIGAFGFGVLQGVVVVKNVPLAVAGGARLGESGLSDAQAVTGVVAFGLVASAGMIVPIVLSVIGGERFDRPLTTLRVWLEANMAAITIVVAVLIGGVLVGRGLAILS